MRSPLLFRARLLALIPAVLAAGCLSTRGEDGEAGEHGRSGRDADAADCLIEPGMTVLFQGDSITDAGRDKKNAQPNHPRALGNGYASFAASTVLVQHAPDELQVFNRGISGNKVFQLAERWDADCLELQPDVVSILIGVNDIWHTKNGRYDGTVAIYERDYDALLTRTRAALPDVRLVVCEPFVLRCGAVKDDWFPEFDEYRAAARRVAKVHDAVFVPFQSMFDEALALHPAEYWAKDGVHPSKAGAALMAKTWVECVHGEHVHEHAEHSDHDEGHAEGHEHGEEHGHDGDRDHASHDG